MQTVRIFISSPGDVETERQRAREVIDSLRRRYSRHFFLKPVFWEDLPLQPDMSFQQGIDVVLSEQGADIAVFILWSRLGSPVGSAIPRPDGGEYRSGTEREFDLMMQSRARSRETGERVRPDVLIYTRRDDASFEELLRGTSTDQKKQIVHQKELVEHFIQESFRDQESGVNVGAYFPFDRPVAFSQRLRTHLQELLDRLAGETSDVVWDTERQGPPFLGLESYQAEHADIFFGREEEILEGRHALRSQAAEGCGFLLLSGASGSGKSSLARAGIVPEIMASELDEQVTGWRSVVLTPAELAPDPITALVHRLADDAILPSLRGEAGSLDQLADALREHPAMAYGLRIKEALAAESRRAGGGIRLLLLIDQLEELFTTATLAAADRAAFLLMLETFARSGSIWVIATVRSDFYQQVQSEPALVRMKGSHGLLDVLPAGPEALARLIQEPARLAGLTFEERDGQSLAARVLKDAAAHAELLPLVSFVLRELYERRTDQRQLSFLAYEELGGVEGALAKRAEQTFANLPDAAQQALGPVLRSLVTLGHDDPQEAGEKIVRHRATLSSFAPGSPGRELVDAFVAARLFTTGRGETSGDPFVTIAHESLLRVWSRAVEWTERNRDFLRIRSRIAARMREGGPLLEGDPLLATARAHLASQPDGFTGDQQTWIRDQVLRAEASSRRSARRRRAALAVLAGFALCAVAGSVLAWKNSQLARVRAAETEREKTRNAAFHLLHRAANLKDAGRLPEALGLFDQAYAIFPDFSTRSALLAGLASAPADLETTFHGFSQGIERLRFASDGTLLAASPGGVCWALNPGTHARHLSGPAPQRLLTLERIGTGWSAWREDGSRMVASLATHDPEARPPMPGPTPWSIAAGAEDTVAFVAADTPRQVTVRSPGSSASADFAGRVACLAVRPGDPVAAGLEDGSVFLVRGSDPPVRLLPATGTGVASLAWNFADPARLLVGDEGGRLTFVAPGDEAGGPQPPRIPCRPVAIEWNPTDPRIAIAGADGRVRLLLPDADGYRIETLPLHRGPVLAVAWSADGTRLASSGQDGTIAIWRPGATAGPLARRQFLDPVLSLDVTANGRSIAAGTAAGEIHTWDEDQGSSSRSAVSGGGVHSLAWSPDGRTLAVGTGDDRVLVIDPGKDEPIATFPGAEGIGPDEVPVPRVRWSPQGALIAAASHSGAVRLLEVPAGISRTLGTLPDLALGLAWNRDGNRIAAASTRGEIFLWDHLTPPTDARRLDGPDGHRQSVGGLAWSPDGGRLASCSNDGTVRLWDPAHPGSPPATVSTGVDSQLEEVVYSDNGEWIATAGSDGFVRIWKADDLSPFAAVRVHEGHAGILVWRGNRLISASEDSSVIILSLDENQWRSRARGLAGVPIESQPLASP